jgi:L-ascorbate oxidase
MTVVEADGNYVHPFQVDDIDIYSGESYSVLLKTDTALKPGSYWISVGVRGRRPKTLPALAVLKYSSSDSAWPVDKPPATPDWEDVVRSKAFTHKINASTAQELPAATGSPIVMLNTQDVVDGHVKWAINHVSLALPATPYLGAYYAGLEREVFNITEAPRTFNANYDVRKPPEAQAPAGKTPTTVRNQVYRFTDGAVVDVVIQNANMRSADTSEAHPWHLHGHDFWVLGYGEGRYDHGRDAEALNAVKNPPLRNTVVVFPFGWTAIRFVADNPGVWEFHCHIEPHLHMGMGVIFAEGIEKLHRLNEIMPKEAMMCGVVDTWATVSSRPPAPAPSP